jgi:hypothetical protein
MTMRPREAPARLKINPQSPGHEAEFLTIRPEYRMMCCEIKQKEKEDIFKSVGMQ